MQAVSQYDIRVKDVKQPFRHQLQGWVNQNTGVDWNNVKLRISPTDPNQGGSAPDLISGIELCRR